MTAAISLSPDPASTGATVTVTGSGFDIRPTRLTIDGVVSGSTFLPSATGAFSKTYVAQSTDGYQEIAAEQCTAGTFTIAATALSTVGSGGIPAAPTPDRP